MNTHRTHQLPSLPGLGGLLALLLLATPSQGEQIYMTVNGSRQGTISSDASSIDSLGQNARPEHANKISVLAAEHLVNVPVDSATGQPIGRAVQRAYKVTTYMDSANPLLNKALNDAEILDLTIEFWRTGSGGSQEHYFTVTLDEAVLISSRTWAPNDPQNETHAMVEYQFSYNSIDWSHEISGTSASHGS